MRIKLLDYKGKEHWVDIPDDTEKIEIEVITGDMIMLSPYHYDTSSTRIYDFNDGACTIKKENFEKLNKCTNSYDIWELTSI